MVLFLSIYFYKLNLKYKVNAIILHYLRDVTEKWHFEHLQLVTLGFCTLALGTERNKFKVREYMYVFFHTASHSL